MPQPRFGAAVRDFRTAKDLNLTWLAREAGVAPSHLSNLERGERRPRPRSLLSITAACRRAGASADEMARLYELGVGDLVEPPAESRTEVEA